MLEKYYLKPQTIDRIRANWLAEPIERYVTWLNERGYAARNVFNRYAEINIRMKQAALQACQPPPSVSSEGCLRKPVWREEPELMKWLKSL